MKNNALLNELINFSGITMRERVLVIDDSLYLCELLDKRNMKLNIDYCNSRNFKSITDNQDNYMNAFDIVLCPECIYNLNINNYQLLLQCIVWSMAKNSKIVFCVPNINMFKLNSYFKINNKEYILKEGRNHFSLCYKYFIFNKIIENWNKLLVTFPTQIFKVWNNTNSLSQWNLNNLKIKQYENYLLYEIDMRKNIK